MPEVCSTMSKTMDWNEIVKQYAPKDCKPTIIKSAKEEALEATAKARHKEVDELTEAELTEAKELAEKYRRATFDPMDAYRD